MVAVNPAGPTAFGGIQGPSNPDGTVFVDTVDGSPALVPSFSGTSGALTPAIVNPLAIPDTAGVPSQNALIVELRVLNNLLSLQLGDRSPDLEQMRADEFFNSSVATGVV